jgi:hypothetical protein
MQEPPTPLERYLLARYSSASPQSVAVRQFVERVCSQFITAGLADANFVTDLCSGNEPRFWQRYTEAVLTCEVLDAGLNARPSRNGPDLCIEHEGRKIWIEFICPEPMGIPAERLDHEPLNRSNFPHVAILLRWTAAIKEKAEKLLGGPRDAGYLTKGIVGPEDCYVIAVNGRQLRGVFAALTGISQFPFAVEAAFAVGPLQIQIDCTTLKSVGSGHQHRPLIKKPTGADVPAYTFLDPRFAAVSAIWATDLDDCLVLGNSKPFVVVYNPMATNRLPEGLLPAQLDYVASPRGSDEYLLEKRPGRLALVGAGTATP